MRIKIVVLIYSLLFVTGIITDIITDGKYHGILILSCMFLIFLILIILFITDKIFNKND
jgi:hypothetical protein